ncbi:unnamed protein product, partial [Rotaria magnacalcarata]
VFKESESLTDKSILARYRRPPKRCQSSSDSVKFSSFEEFYRQQYMESLEIAVNMLQNRSTQKNFKLLCMLRSLFFMQRIIHLMIQMIIFNQLWIFVMVILMLKN